MRIRILLVAIACLSGLGHLANVAEVRTISTLLLAMSSVTLVFDYIRMMGSLETAYTALDYSTATIAQLEKIHELLREHIELIDSEILSSHLPPDELMIKLKEHAVQRRKQSFERLKD